MNYPRIEKLGVPLREGCVMCKDLDTALEHNGMSKTTFDEYFGVQTCAVIDGEHALYPSDVEAVLERMISGKLTGTQLFWD